MITTSARLDMKIWFQIVLALIALVLIYWLVTTVTNYLIWAVVFVWLAAVIIGFLPLSWSDRKKLPKPNKRRLKRVEKAAERTLKELETRAESDSRH